MCFLVRIPFSSLLGVCSAWSLKIPFRGELGDCHCFLLICFLFSCWIVDGLHQFLLCKDSISLVCLKMLVLSLNRVSSPKVQIHSMTFLGILGVAIYLNLASRTDCIYGLPDDVSWGFLEEPWSFAVGPYSLRVPFHGFTEGISGLQLFLAMRTVHFRAGLVCLTMLDLGLLWFCLVRIPFRGLYGEFSPLQGCLKHLLFVSGLFLRLSVSNLCGGVSKVSFLFFLSSKSPFHGLPFDVNS